MLSIQTNVNSMNAQENLRVTNDFQARTIARLTSGYRINQSGDDAAGLAVANKYRSDIAELSQGVRNANDGLSTMQIIDGGLSNISKMLDRLKTLSTQSASSGFEGDRATVDREFQALLSEIDRQASNIGLSDSGGSASRYHKDLKIYTGGGGDYSANSGVQIDLSATSDVVTSDGLGLTGQNILGGDGTNAGNAIALTTNVTTDMTFSFNIEGQPLAISATVDGQANGYTGADALKDLNDQIGKYGIRASVVSNSSSSELRFFSDKAFTVGVTGGGGAGDLVTAAAPAGAFLVNTDINRNTVTATGIGGGGAATNNGTFVITFADNSTESITVNHNTTQDQALTKLQTALADNGITVMKGSGATGFVFMSKTQSNFAVGFDNDAGTVYTDVNTDSYNAANVSSNTSTSEAALAAVNSAVAALGIVQGKIGTAQNKLNYAIQLAQSQITNFSAAESRIRDADIASEAANLTKAQVLSQASMAALAQANSAPQSVLSLLRG